MITMIISPKTFTNFDFWMRTPSDPFQKDSMKWKNPSVLNCKLATKSCKLRSCSTSSVISSREQILCLFYLGTKQVFPWDVRRWAGTGWAIHRIGTSPVRDRALQVGEGWSSMEEQESWSNRIQSTKNGSHPLSAKLQMWQVRSMLLGGREWFFSGKICDSFSQIGLPSAVSTYWAWAKILDTQLTWPSQPSKFGLPNDLTQLDPDSSLPTELLLGYQAAKLKCPRSAKKPGRGATPGSKLDPTKAEGGLQNFRWLWISLFGGMTVHG